MISASSAYSWPSRRRVSGSFEASDEAIWACTRSYRASISGSRSESSTPGLSRPNHHPDPRSAARVVRVVLAFTPIEVQRRDLGHLDPHGLGPLPKLLLVGIIQLLERIGLRPPVTGRAGRGRRALIAARHVDDRLRRRRGL